jgi:two-component system, chemotaxis family, response regulator Rcp1
MRAHKKHAQLHNGPMSSDEHPIILLIEDNPGDAFLISLIVTEASVPVTIDVARDGVEALFKLAQLHPELVILDLNLPVISGHDILRRYHPSDVPVVVFSSSGSEAERRESLAEGAREFVQKPTGCEDYKRVVLEMIHKWVSLSDGLAPA